MNGNDVLSRAARCEAAWMLMFALAMVVPSASAENFPNRPIKIVTGFAAGAGSDAAARLLAQKMSEGLGQPVIVENRPGAAGLLANEVVAKAKPDGYSLLLIVGAYPVQAAMMKKLPYDPLRDFAMISMVMDFPFVLIVNADSPFKTLNDFVSYARANPSKLNSGSSGLGSSNHLASELFNVMAGTEMTHIPFRGGAIPITELMAGRIDAVFEPIVNALPFLKGGKVRPLAVTSLKPSPFLANVPPMNEVLPGFEVVSFFGLMTTAGTPANIVTQLNAEIRRVLALPEVRQRFRDLGGEAQATSPDEMQRFIEAEINKWKQVVAKRNIERI